MEILFIIFHSFIISFSFFLLGWNGNGRFVKIAMTKVSWCHCEPVAVSNDWSHGHKVWFSALPSYRPVRAALTQITDLVVADAARRNEKVCEIAEAPGSFKSGVQAFWFPPCQEMREVTDRKNMQAPDGLWQIHTYAFLSLHILWRSKFNLC